MQIMGAFQLRNGDDMYTIALDNQKQAEATEFLARDAKRDGEIMKTITVVTLIYLPATFVCVCAAVALSGISGLMHRRRFSAWESSTLTSMQGPAAGSKSRSRGGYSSRCPYR